MIEQTLSIIKPDAVERNLENKIKDFFEKNNLTISKTKKVKISKEEASEFYKVHQTKPFYTDLYNYLSSGPIVAMILEGENAISKNRQLMGATDPLKAEEGTLRKMYGISIDKNSVHGSDSLTNGKKEIDFFNEQGYLKIKNVIDHEQINDLGKTVLLLCRKYASDYFHEISENNVFANEHFHDCIIKLKAEKPSIFGAIYDSIQCSVSLQSILLSKKMLDIISSITGEPSKFHSLIH